MSVLSKLTLTASISLALLTACSTDTALTLADPRDNKTYRTVKIGGQIWMAENLNFEAEGSRCYYNKAENCTKYGRLYNWQTALKACPKGWHLPDTTEWNVLVDFAGGDDVAGKNLKAANGWNDDEDKAGNGEDKFGFAALPGGYGTSNGDVNYVGDDGFWWSASESNANVAYNSGMSYNYEDAFWDDNDKSGLFSVRCVKD